MKTKQLLSIIISLCIFVSTLLPAIPAFALTENEVNDTTLDTNIENNSTSESIVNYSATTNIITSGDFDYFVNEDGQTATIIYYAGQSYGDIIFPNEIDGYKVIAIGDGKYCVCESFWYNSIIIPDSVTTINDGAFQYCDNITGFLKIPESVTYIGDGAFVGCSGLTGELILSEQIESIGDWAFAGCSKLTGSLVIPSSVNTLGEYAFENCIGFTSLQLNDGITSIGNSAFLGCSGFTGSLVIPNSVTLIDSYAFSGCIGFNGTLTIPGSVESIKEYSFEKTSFSSLEIQEGVNVNRRFCIFRM